MKVSTKDFYIDNTIRIPLRISENLKNRIPNQWLIKNGYFNGFDGDVVEFFEDCLKHHNFIIDEVNFYGDIIFYLEFPYSEWKDIPGQMEEIMNILFKEVQNIGKDTQPSHG